MANCVEFVAENDWTLTLDQESSRFKNRQARKADLPFFIAEKTRQAKNMRMKPEQAKIPPKL